MINGKPDRYANWVWQVDVVTGYGNGMVTGMVTAMVTRYGNWVW